MQRDFTADIHINITKNAKNIVSIIPFYDKDKTIAKQIEKVLNQYLAHEGPINFDREDCLSRLTFDA